jgi:hypothetical protein
MPKLRLFYFMLVCLVTSIAVAGCAGETMYNNAGSVGESGNIGAQSHRRVIVDENLPPDGEPDNAGVTLEITNHTASAVYFVIKNNTNHSIRYGNGYELTGDQWGSAGEADSEFYDLLSGEQITSYANVNGIGFGEFRLAKNIIIDPENPANAQEYKLVAEFVIENTKILADPGSVTMEADQDFAASYGVLIEITNGFNDGRIYFDRSFWLQRYTDDEWTDVPLTGSNDFPYETHSLASRQIKPIIVYWAWLYDELPPGEYRIGKSFLHRSGDGEDAQYDVFATFILDGGPVLSSVRKGYSDVNNPLGGITTFRAEVTEHLDPVAKIILQGGRGLLVESLSTFWNDWNSNGDPFYIYDNPAVVNVLDTNNEHITFSDIPIGAIIDITFSGMILMSYPGIIGGTLLISIVG